MGSFVFASKRQRVRSLSRVVSSGSVRASARNARA